MYGPVPASWVAERLAEHAQSRVRVPEDVPGDGVLEKAKSGVLVVGDLAGHQVVASRDDGS